MHYNLSPATLRKLDALAASAATPAMVEHLRALFEGGSDFDLFKMNAFRLAEATGVPRREAVRALLFATRLGLVDLSWDIHCPACTAVADAQPRLVGLGPHAHCQLCELRWDIDFADQVEVTFSANPEARPIQYQELRERAVPERMDYVQEVDGREQRVPAVLAVISPGTGVEVRGRLDAGEHSIRLPGCSDDVAFVRVAGAPANEEQVVALTIHPDGRVTPERFDLHPGPVRFVLDNRLPHPQWAFKVLVRQRPNNWVSAAYVTGLQDFRDLFSGEFLAPGVSFAIRSVTFLFSDIKGSTELYETLGDARAYALVQQHFALMTEVIRRHDGGIVKTIGDAVMATFPTNRDGVAAALEIQLGFAAARPEMDMIEVKLGLHRGPAIAVTSNRMLDFFGRTVNIAARVQGESAPREVLVTEAVLEDPEVAAMLVERRLSPRGFEASLKGIAGRSRLYSLQPIFETGSST